MPGNPGARRDHILRAISDLRTGPQRRYPSELRGKIAAYARERVRAGTPLTRVGSELGVSHPTLVRILGESSAPLRRVRVAETKVSKAESRPTLIVRGPAGLTIEGLGVEDVATLLRALS